VKLTISIPHVTLTAGHDSRLRHIALGKAPEFLVPACGAAIITANLVTRDGRDIPIHELCTDCMTAIKYELPQSVVDALEQQDDDGQAAS